MRLIALLWAVVLIAPVFAEEVYKTTDAAGNVIYTDKPSPEAEKIQIQEAQTVPADEAPPFKYTPPAQPAQRYTSLTIVSPANDESLRPEDDSVRVAARLEPQFRGQDTFVLFLDGKEHSSGKSSSFLLNGLDRGTHQVSVKIRDPNGTDLISSAPVTFHILKVSVLPKKAPAPGTPPKPSNPPKTP